MPTAVRDRDMLLAHDFPPMDGGIARWMAAIAERYPPDSLTVSTGEFSGSVESDARFTQRIDRVPVSVNRLRTLPGLLTWSRRAVQLARESPYRFAWCDTIRPSAYVAHWTWRRTALPYGIMVVGNDILTLREKLGRSARRRRIMRAVLGDAAVFVTISQWTAAQCTSLLSELQLVDSSNRVRTILLGTDPDKWRADPDGAAQFRERRGLPAGRWLVSVARLVEYKGIDTAIRLVARLANEYADLQYAVIGRGPHEVALRALAAELGVADRVHILTDVADNELAAAYSVGRMYIGLTRETPLDVEGFGISFAEAAACGVPVIAARSGGIPDAVVDGETGMLVDPVAMPEIEGAVRQLLDNEELAKRMGAAGRARVESELNWERVVREMRGVVSRSS